MPQVCNFIKKEILAQAFSCEFWGIFKKNVFYRTPRVAASNDCKTSILVFEDSSLKLIENYCIGSEVPEVQMNI